MVGKGGERPSVSNLQSNRLIGSLGLLSIRNVVVCINVGGFPAIVHVTN